MTNFLAFSDKATVLINAGMFLVDAQNPMEVLSLDRVAVHDVPLEFSS